MRVQPRPSITHMPCPGRCPCATQSLAMIAFQHLLHIVPLQDIDPAVQDTYIILMGTGLVMSLTVVILVTVLISQIGE